jgi:hypothetical protein
MPKCWRRLSEKCETRGKNGIKKKKLEASTQKMASFLVIESFE